MAISWSRCTIKDFLDNGEAEIKTGPFGTQLHASDYVEQGTPVINVRNIGFGEIRPENLEFIADETVKRLSSHLLDAGDIVFGRKGAVERHAFIKSKWAGWFQGSDCLRVRFKSPSVESRFLSYCFLSEKHKQWMINQCSHGATMASLNQDIICRIPLRLPPIDTQKKITAVLSGYDDLIENNTRRIRILEEVAQAIYREWFVHFRFPGHKKVKLVNSPIGQIPDGWRAGRLDEAVVLQRGFDLPGSSRRQGNVPVYAATGVVGKHDEAKVNGPGVVTGRSGSLGTVTPIFCSQAWIFRNSILVPPSLPLTETTCMACRSCFRLLRPWRSLTRMWHLSTNSSAA